MIKTNMYQFHRLNTLHRQFEKWQAVEPRLCKFKNREEFLAYVDKKYQTELQAMGKLKAEYQTLVKTKYSAKNVKKQIQENNNNSLVDNFITHYKKNKGNLPQMSDEDVNRLLTELDNNIFQ
ncbi:hypothetical protein [Spiroplasma poulsonii]|uniref:hypothetical protein n=1 Tax=Spiroplasma poulsonii TaxID=2138 RepID=UPI001F4CBAF3|nr:hypothetical protein [Spiroplasma poulsonii]UNF61936.1 hypothetical protein MNU24_00245 [Spiroplasma poulsonii]